MTQREVPKSLYLLCALAAAAWLLARLLGH
jgi:hypothetical protein